MDILVANTYNWIFMMFGAKYRMFLLQIDVEWKAEGIRLIGYTYMMEVRI